MKKIALKLLTSAAILSFAVMCSGVNVSAATEKVYYTDAENVSTESVSTGVTEDHLTPRPGYHLFKSLEINSAKVSEWVPKSMAFGETSVTYDLCMGKNEFEEGCMQPIGTAYCPKLADSGEVLTSFQILSSRSELANLKEISKGVIYKSVHADCGEVVREASIPDDLGFVKESANVYWINFDANESQTDGVHTGAKYKVNGSMSKQPAYVDNASYYEDVNVLGTKNTLSDNLYSRVGYIFKGWNTKADGSGQWYSDQDEIYKSGTNLVEYYGNEAYCTNESEVTLYAQWEYSTCIVKLNTQGGKYNGVVNYSAAVEYGDTIEIKGSLVDPTGTTGHAINYYYNGSKIATDYTQLQFCRFTVDGVTNTSGQILTNDNNVVEFFTETQTRTDRYNVINNNSVRIKFYGAKDSEINIKVEYEDKPFTLRDTGSSTSNAWYWDSAYKNLAGYEGESAYTNSNVNLYAKQYAFTIYSNNNSAYKENANMNTVMNWKLNGEDYGFWRIYKGLSSTNMSEVGVTGLVNEAGSLAGVNTSSFNKTFSSDTTFTIVQSGWYRIDAYGQAGDGLTYTDVEQNHVLNSNGDGDRAWISTRTISHSGGKGGRVGGTYYLKKGQQLKIEVNKGRVSGSSSTGGGYTAYYLDGTLLGLAGGGGAASYHSDGYDGGQDRTGYSREYNTSDQRGEGSITGGAGWKNGTAGWYRIHHCSSRCLYPDIVHYNCCGHSIYCKRSWTHQSGFNGSCGSYHGLSDTHYEWGWNECVHGSPSTGGGNSSSNGAYNYSGESNDGDSYTHYYHTCRGDCYRKDLLEAEVVCSGHETETEATCPCPNPCSNQNCTQKSYGHIGARDIVYTNCRGESCGSNGSPHGPVGCSGCGDSFSANTTKCGGKPAVYSDPYCHNDGGDNTECSGSESSSPDISGTEYCSGYYNKGVTYCHSSDGPEGNIYSSAAASGGYSWMNTSDMNAYAGSFSTSVGANSGNGYVTLVCQHYASEATDNSYIYAKFTMSDNIGPNKIVFYGNEFQVVRKNNKDYVKVGFKEVTDRGTDWFFRVDHCNVGGQAIKTGNIVKETALSEVKGYYWLVNSSATATAAQLTNFVSNAQFEFDASSLGLSAYLHVCAIDYAGNRSEVTSINLASFEYSIGNSTISITNPNDETNFVYTASGKTWVNGEFGKSHLKLSTLSNLTGFASDKYHINRVEITGEKKNSSGQSRVKNTITEAFSGDTVNNSSASSFNINTRNIFLMDSLISRVSNSEAHGIQVNKNFDIAASRSNYGKDLATNITVNTTGKSSEYIDISCRASIVRNTKDRVEGPISNSVRVYVDTTKPVIYGLDKLKGWLEQDRLTVNDAVLELTTSDSESGVQPTRSDRFFARVVNDQTGKAEDYYPDSTGKITILLERANALFIGDFTVEVTSIDNVGNVNVSYNSATEMDIDMSVTRDKMAVDGSEFFNRSEYGTTDLFVEGGFEKITIEYLNKDGTACQIGDSNVTELIDGNNLYFNGTYKFRIPQDLYDPGYTVEYICRATAYRGSKSITIQKSFWVRSASDADAILNDLQTTIDY